MVNEFLFTKIEEEDIGNILFQQDGATCHTAEATLDVWRPVFEDRVISHRADVVWPPRNCDLTPLDYCLWGAVKDKCYADKPGDNIREAIGAAFQYMRADFLCPKCDNFTCLYSRQDQKELHLKKMFLFLPKSSKVILQK